MRKLFVALFFISTMLVAGEEVILTIPKSGSHYFVNLLSVAFKRSVIGPINPFDYEKLFEKYEDTSTLVVGHAEPQTMHKIDLHKQRILLIRDPRDVVLSAVEMIDRKGVQCWFGLAKYMSDATWKNFSFQQKAETVLYGCFNARNASVHNCLECALDFMRDPGCICIKYEEISPKNDDKSLVVTNLQLLSKVFNHESNAATLLDACEKAFQMGSRQFNTGRTYRYRSEITESDLRFLNDSLFYYINEFGYE